MGFCSRLCLEPPACGSTKEFSSLILPILYVEYVARFVDAGSSYCVKFDLTCSLVVFFVLLRSCAGRLRRHCVEVWDALIPLPRMPTAPGSHIPKRFLPIARIVRCLSPVGGDCYWHHPQVGRRRQGHSATRRIDFVCISRSRGSVMHGFILSFISRMLLGFGIPSACVHVCCCMSPVCEHS